MLCLMQTNVHKLYMACEYSFYSPDEAKLVAARSTQYAEQARTATNVFAKKTFEYFEEDWNLTERFHSMLDRKWDQSVLLLFVI
jgi:hypothetical protein